MNKITVKQNQKYNHPKVGDIYMCNQGEWAYILCVDYAGDIDGNDLYYLVSLNYGTIVTRKYTDINSLIESVYTVKFYGRDVTINIQT